MLKYIEVSRNENTTLKIEGEKNKQVNEALKTINSAITNETIFGLGEFKDSDEQDNSQSSIDTDYLTTKTWNIEQNELISISEKIQQLMNDRKERIENEEKAQQGISDFRKELGLKPSEILTLEQATMMWELDNEELILNKIDQFPVVRKFGTTTVVTKSGMQKAFGEQKRNIRNKPLNK